jgi:hypothetical protein
VNICGTFGVHSGADSFYARGEADEVEGLDEFVEEWTTNLWVPLRKALKTSHVAPSDSKAEEEEDDTIKGELALPKCKLEVSCWPSFLRNFQYFCL